MIERVSCFPNEGTPEVIPGEPQDGDIVRINGSVYQRYKAPVEAPPADTPMPPTLTEIKTKLDELTAMVAELS